MKRIISLMIVAFICIFSCYKVEAQTLGDLKKELKEEKAKYGVNESKKKMTQAQIDKVSGELDELNSQIDSLNGEISSLNSDIEKRNEEIKKMNEEIKSIVHYYQLSSSESFYLEYIFKATDFTDFIYRLAISEQLSEYREKTIDKYNQMIEENKKKIGEMASKKTELSKLEKEASSKYSTLNGELTGIKTAGISISDEIADLEKKISKFQNTYKCSDNEEISACTYRYNNPGRSSYSSGRSGGGGSSYSTNVASSSGFYRPISYWTHTYPFLHHDKGFDLSTPEGQTVTPVADGIVSEVWSRYSCGGNMVWIVHNVNGKKYTSAYYHLKSYNVHVGQSVSHTTVIGYSGGARRGTSTNSYDNCTTGPHLHLQMAYGYYDPNYLFSGGYSTYSRFDGNSFNPTSVINF